MWAKSDWHLPDTCKCVQAPGGAAVKPSDNVHLPGLRRKWPSAREEAEDLESTGRKPNRPAHGTTAHTAAGVQSPCSHWPPGPTRPRDVSCFGTCTTLGALRTGTPAAAHAI